MLPSDIEDGIVVARLSGKVDRHDRFGFRTDRFLHRLRIDIERVRLAVDQHRTRAQIMNHFSGRRERHRRNQDFVAGFDADRVQRQMKRRSARVKRNGMRRADIRCEILFELFGLESRRQPAGAQRLDHRLDLVLADVGEMKGEGTEGGA